MENSSNSQNNVREFKVEKDSIQFLFSNTDSSPKEISLKAGYEYIIQTYFSDKYPKEGDIEKTLNYIEYELTKHPELKNNKETLVCANDMLAEILDISEQSIVSKERIELAFDRFVDCAYGRPATVLGINYSTEKLAIAILIRTVMYYLNFEEITVIRS